MKIYHEIVHQYYHKKRRKIKHWLIIILMAAMISIFIGILILTIYATITHLIRNETEDLITLSRCSCSLWAVFLEVANPFANTTRHYNGSSLC